MMLTLLLSAIGLQAQTVTTEPSPLQEDSKNVVIFFHADQGDQGLINQPASQPVYAHTGVSVVTNDGKVADWQYVQAEWATNLPKCRLDYVSENLWKLQIGDIHEFYGVPADVTIKRLDFVFRSADGQRQGKNPGQTDIFVDVADTGFQIALTATQPQGIVNGATGEVNFTMASTVAAELSIEINGNAIKSASSAKTISAGYTFPAVGDYLVTAKARNSAGETKTATLSYCYAAESVKASGPAPQNMGATRNNDGSMTFCLAAPQKKSAMIVGSWNDFSFTNSQVMKYSDETIDGQNFRFFFITLPPSVVARGETYTYFYTVDGIQVGDPYATLVLDPYFDKYISPEVFPDLPEYPADRLQGVPLAVIKENLQDYNWTTTSFNRPDKDNLIIYELLLRDFTGTEGEAQGNGTVKKAISKIPYLKRLGINAVELLPINEFNGNISWGYNPNFYFAVDKAYGTPADYKEFIDRCHAEGIAVILDMVFNQSDGMHPWYQMYMPEQNPFYNVTAPHAYSVLNDWNQGYPLVDRQWKDCLQYWLREYKVDGFRFDLVKGLGNNDSYANPGDQATNEYNASRVARMKKLHSYMKEVNPDAYFINENLAGAREENEMAADGELNWLNLNEAGCQFAMGYSSDSGLNSMLATNAGRTVGSTVSYLESHDEQRLAYKQEMWGVAGVKNDKAASCRRLGAAAAQMLLVPGSHMIWQFSEMGNAQNTKNSNGGNNTDPKIVNWSLLNDPDNLALFYNYRNLISIRLNNPELFSPEADYTISAAASNWAQGRMITSKAGNKELYALINPNVSGELTMSVPFSSSDNNAYEIIVKSNGTEPDFNAANKTATVPANSMVVIANKNVTGIETVSIEAAGPKIFTSGNRIIVEGYDGNVSVWNISGLRIANCNNDEIKNIALPGGIYIVKAGEMTTKVIISR